MVGQLPMGMLDDDFFVRYVSLFQEVATSYLEGADNVDNVVTGTLVTLVTNFAAIVTTVVTMFVLDWRLSLLALAVVPLMILPLSPVGRRMYVVRPEGLAALRDFLAEFWPDSLQRLKQAVESGEPADDGA